VCKNLQRNIEARSYNHGCRGKAANITHSECLFAALVIYLAMRMRRGLSGSTDIFTLSHIRARFSDKRWGTQDACFDFLYIFILKYFPFYKEFSQILS